MSSLPARTKKIQLKMKALECSRDFSHNKPVGIFSDAQGQQTPQSMVRNFMAVLITCNNENDPIKNKGARVATRYVEFSGAQGQITPKSVVGSCKNSNSFKFLCMYLLSARMREMQSKMNSLEWKYHFSHYTSMGIFQFT